MECFHLFDNSYNIQFSGNTTNYDLCSGIVKKRENYIKRIKIIRETGYNTIKDKESGIGGG